MQVAYAPNIFRRNPKLGIGLGVILLAVGGVGFFVMYGDYKTLGTAPVPMTIAQAFAAPDAARWVTLTEPLDTKCETSLDETSNGVVTGSRYLASDAAGARWIYLRLHGQVRCDALPELTGILKKADSALPAWLEEKGVHVPQSSSPLLELSVGDSPGSTRTMLWIFAFVAALGMVITIVFLAVGRKPKIAPRRFGPGA